MRSDYGSLFKVMEAGDEILRKMAILRAEKHGIYGIYYGMEMIIQASRHLVVSAYLNIAFLNHEDQRLHLKVEVSFWP